MYNCQLKLMLNTNQSINRLIPTIFFTRVEASTYSLDIYTTELFPLNTFMFFINKCIIVNEGETFVLIGDYLNMLYIHCI